MRRPDAEDGFKLLGDGHPERLLGATPRSTTPVQSISLVPLLTISFLSAGLNSLIGGMGIVFGAKLGTTTGARLVGHVAQAVGIGQDDHALKLAILHAIFNAPGARLMLPLMGRLVVFLERRLPESRPCVSRPRHPNAAIDEFPEILESALREEVPQLCDTAVKLVLHGLDLHRETVFAASDLASAARRSRAPVSGTNGNGG